MNRIATIISHLLDQPDEFLAVFYGNACLLHVDDIELQAIKRTLLLNKKEL